MPSELAGDDRDIRFRRFWEARATKYPLPFDEEPLSNTNRIISLVKQSGVAISQSRIHRTKAEVGLIVWSPL